MVITKKKSQPELNAENVAVDVYPIAKKTTTYRHANISKIKIKANFNKV